MPAINTIPVNPYEPNSAYNHLVDNAPILEIIEQLNTINTQVDLNTLELLSAIGTAGSLSNRLNQSLEQDGSLMSSAIDSALHSIEEHTDTADYVRMTAAERNKLTLIDDEATSLTIVAETDDDGDLTFDNTTLTIAPSSSIVMNYVAGKLQFETDFPSSVRHNHYYGLEAVTSNYLDYIVTSIATAYKENSLRVYVNGVRLNTDHTVYVPFNSSGSVTWTLLKFTEGTATSGIVTAGDFTLSATISSSASVIVDFDVLYS